MNKYVTYLPWTVLALAALFLASKVMPASEPRDGFHLSEFGLLPMVDRGRIQPIDTKARTALMVISGKQTFVDAKGNTQPAIRWFLDALATRSEGGGPALEHKVFRIENDQVLSLLGLEPRSGFRYSLAEIRPRAAEFYAQAQRARGVDPKKRDLYDNKLVELAQHLEVFLEVSQWHFLSVPVAAKDEQWLSVRDAVQSPHKVSQAIAQIQLELVDAYAGNDPTAFNKMLKTYADYLDREIPVNVGTARFETFFNHFAPFYQSAVLYAFVFVLGCSFWLGWREDVRRSAFWLGCLALAVHSWALFARMYIQGRPPVTNLYSSAVFIGWGCVIVGLILEYIYRNGFGVVVASATGGLTLIVAHYLSLGGDTMEMMQAVLDTNFWLATHVTCITLGYTACFVAGFLGIFYILGSVLTPWLHNDLRQSLIKMIYGVICFAMLLSFTGTVLGGIWADQSWGRFWGWDPKENGALLIVIWNALILHARWGGMIKQRGLANLAIAGNIVTAWSWFGVNMLGVGLHSYGFMAGALRWLLVFDISQLAIIAVGLTPLERWRSLAQVPQDKPTAPPKGPSQSLQPKAVPTAS